MNFEYKSQSEDLGKIQTRLDAQSPVMNSDEVVSTLANHLDIESRARLLQWPNPTPLPNNLPPVEPFDFKLLPEDLRPWAEDICERMQCPPDYVGVAMMVGLATVIGRRIGIRPQSLTDWTEVPNLWGMIVGRPGAMKSPAIEAALSPLHHLGDIANQNYQEEFDEFRIKAKASKIHSEEAEKRARAEIKKTPDADISKFLNVEEAEEPRLKRYIVNDSSAAALGEIHRHNQNGLLVHRDELVSLLKSLDRDDNAEARGFYLTGWNGNSSYTFDRIGRGLNLHIPAICLSMLGGTQPGRISEYVNNAIKGGSADDGLMQRFGLLVWPDVEGKWINVDRQPDNEAKRKAFEVFERLAAMQPEQYGAKQDTNWNGEPAGIPFLRFLQEAGEAFLEWRTKLETRLRSSELHPAMESHLAKYRKLVPGLSLIIHLAEGGVGDVSLNATIKALAWSEYLESHARRVYASVSNPQISAAEQIIKRIKNGDIPESFAAWNIWRSGWASLSDKNNVKDALELLVELNWLDVYEQKTNGRTATVYEVNPKVTKL